MGYCTAPQGSPAAQFTDCSGIPTYSACIAEGGGDICEWVWTGSGLGPGSGDITFDGTIDVHDIVALIDIILKELAYGISPSEAQIIAGDIAGCQDHFTRPDCYDEDGTYLGPKDGKLNVMDVIALVDRIQSGYQHPRYAAISSTGAACHQAHSCSEVTNTKNTNPNYQPWSPERCCAQRHGQAYQPWEWTAVQCGVVDETTIGSTYGSPYTVYECFENTDARGGSGKRRQSRVKMGGKRSTSRGPKTIKVTNHSLQGGFTNYYSNERPQVRSDEWDSFINQLLGLYSHVPPENDPFIGDPAFRKIATDSHGNEFEASWHPNLCAAEGNCVENSRASIIPYCFSEWDTNGDGFIDLLDVVQYWNNIDATYEDYSPEWTAALSWLIGGGDFNTPATELVVWCSQGCADHDTGSFGSCCNPAQASLYGIYPCHDELIGDNAIYPMGDVNFNGMLDINDVLQYVGCFVQDCFSGAEFYGTWNEISFDSRRCPDWELTGGCAVTLAHVWPHSDINGDGKANILDVLAIIEIILNTSNRNSMDKSQRRLLNNIRNRFSVLKARGVR